MRRTRTKPLGWILVGGLMLAATTTGDVRAAKHVIKLTTLAPKGSSYHRSLQRMGETWRQTSGGAVDLIVYAGGIQGGEAAMVERMWINQAQAGLLTAVGLEEIEPSVSGLQNMPMMFRTLDEVDYIGEQLQPKLEKRMLDKGFVVLGWVDTGWVRFFSRSPVVHVDDLKKMKLFAWAGDTKTMDVMTRAGLRPVPLETADILTGLQTGLIDAVPLPPFYALASQIYRPAPHMLDLNWAPLVGALVITKRAWDRLPSELRPKLLEAAGRAGAEIKAAGRREGAQAVTTMKDKWGLTVHEITPEIENEWREVAETAYPSIRGQIVPADIFDEVRRLLETYRAAGEASD
jgi:TRAP-type C4-dicarboxylate transport system substrate-binding protein